VTPNRGQVSWNRGAPGLIGIIVAPPTIELATIGIPDTLFLMLLALVVFGPRRLPEIGRQIGKLMYEFRKVSNDFKYQMEEELRASEEADRQKKLAAAAALSASLPPLAPALPAITQEKTEEANETLMIAAQSATEPRIDFIAEPPRAESTPESRPGGAPTLPSIQPPSTGDPVEAARPFRYRVPEEAPSETPPATATEAEAAQETGAPHA